jgi:hypothetical protein
MHGAFKLNDLKLRVRVEKGGIEKIDASIDWIDNDQNAELVPQQFSLI